MYAFAKDGEVLFLCTLCMQFSLLSSLYRIEKGLQVLYCMHIIQKTVEHLFTFIHHIDIIIHLGTSFLTTYFQAFDTQLALKITLSRLSQERWKLIPAVSKLTKL